MRWRWRWLGVSVAAVVLLTVSHAAIGLLVNLGNLYAVRAGMARPPTMADWAGRAASVYQVARSFASARTDLARQIAEAFVYGQNWEQANAQYDAAIPRALKALEQLVERWA